MFMMMGNVKSHSRTCKSGKVCTVKKHNRKMNGSLKPFEGVKGVFHLPIRTGIIVPSTSDTSKKISQDKFLDRINETRKFLSNANGGFTSLKAVGGFTDKDGKLVKEKVVVVESYATKEDFRKNRPKVVKFLRKKGKEWKQEAMGYEHEDDLYYLDTKK